IRLENLFKKNMYDYDVIVNCVLWDTNRSDRIIDREDLASFKPGTMIVDISCIHGLEIESTVTKPIDELVNNIDGVIHYKVDNTPAMFTYSETGVLSKGYDKYVDKLLEGENDPMLKEAMINEKGHILDEDVRKFREARVLE